MQETEIDIATVDQWRGSHSKVLDTFKIFFRRRIESSGSNAEFVQRLKRRNTVIDKLRRRKSDGSKLIGDVTSMQDFAGCRLIFENLDALYEFRKFLHSPANMKNVDHSLKHAAEPDKYNYIREPKWTGYRGLHEVFYFKPRSHRRDVDTAKPWRNLLCEVQYRTQIQHAWATALEISDFLDGERTKFALENDPHNDRVVFFSLASELLARVHEDCAEAFPEKTTQDLQSEVKNIEDRLGILKRLKAMRAFENYPSLGRHNVLNLTRGEEDESTLEVYVFKNQHDAIEKSKELESSPESLNAVYVSAAKPSELRRAFKNYFYDPVDFVELVEQALVF